MNQPTPSTDTPNAFGVKPSDEFLHPFNPGDESWNESYFWDWYNEDGSLAGHCRIGLLTGQDRLWLWLFLYDGEGWTAIEEPHLPLDRLNRELFSFDWQGLAFRYQTDKPLASGALRVQGFGRTLNGPAAGRIVPVDVSLELAADGVAHSIGENKIKGHADAQYSTSRYEQPITASVSMGIGGQTYNFTARGERDHSWGPRLWNMDWHFLVANGADYRFQSTVVRIQNLSEIKVGYLTRKDTQNLVDVAYSLTYHDDDPWRAVEGTYTLSAADGTVLSGTIEPISGVEIDLSHSFAPPQASIYRRTLVRLTPDDGSAPVVGWLEINRMLD